MKSRAGAALVAIILVPLTAGILSIVDDSPAISSTIGTMNTETPTRASAFVDSIGIDTHFDQDPYRGAEYPEIAKLLKDSGIKHIRESVINRPVYISRLKALAQSGIRTTIVTRPDLSDSLIETYPSMIAPSMEAYEGPNEPDLGKDANWSTTMRTFMQRLHDDVKGNPATAQYPIVAPAVTKNHVLLGDITPYIDYGNMHNYFSTFNPGTRGWGRRTAAGVYGSLPYNINLIRPISGSKPIETTETGYGSTPSGGSGILDDVTQGKYIPRVYFVQYNAGIARTFVYELLDSDRTGRTYTNFGLIDIDLKPKPAYNAVQAVIADLADVSTPFVPRPLSYQMSGDTKNVEHMLLQKANGDYYLALWIEAPSWRNGERVRVAPQSVSVRTLKAMSSAAVLRLADNGSPSTTVLRQDGKHDISLQVTDSVSIVKLAP